MSVLCLLVCGVRLRVGSVLCVWRVSLCLVVYMRHLHLLLFIECVVSVRLSVSIDLGIVLALFSFFGVLAQ